MLPVDQFSEEFVHFITQWCVLLLCVVLGPCGLPSYAFSAGSTGFPTKKGLVVEGASETEASSGVGLFTVEYNQQK